jgi:DNA processing protein
MSFPIHELAASEFPSRLHEIPQPPKQLNYRGVLPGNELKLLTVVGSRKYTSYGKQCVDHLIGGLRGYRVGIVSGLALGIDSLAHEAALVNNLYTLAIPGSGLDDSVLYPATHKPLARKILEAGGGLLSEFDPTLKAADWTFPQRNRLVAGISQATLLIEAAERSGTLITARMTTDYNRELLVVPGSIFSRQHDGIHQFLKLGATPVTCATDILDVLNIDTHKAHQPTLTDALPNLTDDERAVLAALHEPMNRDELMRALQMPIEKATPLLMMMELGGLVVQSAGMYRAGR